MRVGIFLKFYVISTLFSLYNRKLRVANTSKKKDFNMSAVFINILTGN